MQKTQMPAVSQMLFIINIPVMMPLPVLEYLELIAKTANQTPPRVAVV